MTRIDDLEAFVAIIEAGGQTAAARHLRRSLQSISRSLVAVEQDLRVELVRRTTRHSEPTEAGHAYYRRLKPALTELNEARLEAANRQAEPSGLLKVGAPFAFAAAHVVPPSVNSWRGIPRSRSSFRHPTGQRTSLLRASIWPCGSANCPIQPCRHAS